MIPQLKRKTQSPAKKITLADIARRSDVSLTTVSLVLRNKPGIGIPAETRQRIMNTAQDLGYRVKTPLKARQGLTTIGVILKARADDLPLANPFYSHVYAGIEAACRQNRINLLNASLPVDENNIPIELPRLLEAEHIEGLLLVGTFVDTTLDHVLGEKSIPVVLVDAYSESNAYDAVVSENFQGAYRAVSYLIEHGHRHIGLVGTGRRAYPSIFERRRGYLEALQDHGIAETYFADCILQPDEAHHCAKELLSRNPQITAMFGANDRVTIAAMHAATELGRRIPDDLSFVGFDDIDLAHLVVPALTTMQVDKISLGRLAVQTLLNRVQMPALPPTVTALRTRLIERQSVKDIR